MAPKCSVCIHAQRAEIDAAVTAGDSLRDVAGRFGTTKSALDRHRPHISQALAKAKESAEVAQADGLLGEVTRLREEAKRLGTKAEQAGKLDVALSAVREQTRIVELLAKIAEVAAKNAPPDGADVDMSGLTVAQLEALASLDGGDAG